MEIEFVRYNGLGNDYLVYDPNKNNLELNEKQIKLICDRNFGVGSDGILVGPFFKKEIPMVKIYNSDGSEAEKSGNGIRIFSKYLKDAQYITSKNFTLHTLGGDVEVEYKNDTGDIMKVYMGKTTYRSSEIPVSGEDREVINEEMEFNGKRYKVTCLSIGNPHCVIPMKHISKEKACELGKYVENSKNFPNRINMQLLKVIDRNNIQIEIHERGSGYTLASGSSSCAAASAAYKLGLVDKEINVHMPGGKIEIEILSDESVYMTGKVNSIGVIKLCSSFVDELLNI